MKDYTNKNPVFSESIRVTETSDPAHADNINAAPEQLLQNTLVNRAAVTALLDTPLLSYDPESETLHFFVFGSTGNDEGGSDIYDAESETLRLFRNGLSGGTQAPSGDGSGHVLPVAGRDVLGCVKVGEGLKAAEDGTISVDTEASAEAAAVLIGDDLDRVTDRDVSRLFGPEGTGAE